MLLSSRAFLLFTCGMIILLCCRFVPNKRLLVPAFYYWKQDRSTWNEEEEGDFSDKKLLGQPLASLAIKRVYVKFFDIDWREGNGAYPRQMFEQAVSPSNLNIEIVPVFYILNRVFEKSDSMDLENLAAHLTKVVGKKYNEIQLDCDWTATTRDRYFQSLTILRRHLAPNIKISATIRLHQIKYRDKTGIPPVDRGMLMVYNMGNPTALNTKNSILDLVEARKYLDGQAKYPMQLDVALPIFRWGIAYRSGKLFSIFNDFNTVQADTTRFLSKKDGAYEVNMDTVYNKKFLRVGDKIKIEEINDDLLRGCAELAAPHVRHTDTLHIAYFHYDHALISSFKSDTYAQVLKIFNR